ncbi:MAG: HU family DNA-binding protein [Proteobacteria bacterium]|jgi:DNA-binding protein HU-beta|nr:HU family DNA-binding protein [Pseudomonadota bacterium]
MGAKSVTKAELVATISREASLSKVDAAKALGAVTGSIQRALVDGRKVTLVGFGTFSVSHRAARMGRDPQTKQPISIPASKGVKFKPGKAMKEAVNI